MAASDGLKPMFGCFRFDVAEASATTTKRAEIAAKTR